MRSVTSLVALLHERRWLRIIPNGPLDRENHPARDDLHPNPNLTWRGQPSRGKKVPFGGNINAGAWVPSTDHQGRVRILQSLGRIQSGFRFPGGILSFDEALDWLDTRGGRWTTHASRSAVDVIVTLGGRQVRATAERLHAEEVRLALVQAVQRLRAML